MESWEVINQGWSSVMCTTDPISDWGMRMTFQKLRSACHWNLRCISTGNIAEIWTGDSSRMSMITIRPCSRICTLSIGCWRGWLGTKRGFHATLSIRLPSKFYCSHAPGLRQQMFFGTNACWGEFALSYCPCPRKKGQQCFYLRMFLEMHP